MTLSILLKKLCSPAGLHPTHALGKTFLIYCRRSFSMRSKRRGLFSFCVFFFQDQVLILENFADRPLMQHITQETRKRDCLGDLWDGSRFKFGKMRHVQLVLAWVDAQVGRLPFPFLHGTLWYIPCSILSCCTSVRRGVCSATAEKTNTGIGTLTHWVALGTWCKTAWRKCLSKF